MLRGTATITIWDGTTVGTGGRQLGSTTSSFTSPAPVINTSVGGTTTAPKTITVVISMGMGSDRSLFSVDSIGYQTFSWTVATGIYTTCGEPKDHYEFGYNGQMKSNEIAGMGNHNTALFWEYDTRLGRRWNLDPVVKTWESPYATFANSPIYYADVKGDDVKNGNKGLLEKANAALTAAQQKFDALKAAHEGSLSKKQITQYEKQSGLPQARTTQAFYMEAVATVDQMIETYNELEPAMYNKMDNIPNGEGGETDVIITTTTLSHLTGEDNDISNAWTDLNLQTQWMKPDFKEVWTGKFNDGPMISLTKSATTQDLANEFGDIDYALTQLRPFNATSYNFWKQSSSPSRSDFYWSKEGAGGYSFDIDKRFLSRFNAFVKEHPERLGDSKRLLLNKK